MLPDEFYKTASPQIRFVEALAVFDDFDEILGMLVAHRHHHAPALGQLVQQLFGNILQKAGGNTVIKTTVIAALVGAHLYSQVYMFNPTVFPEDYCIIE